jgi:hypothetical protein
MIQTKDVTSPESFEYIINQLSLGAKTLSINVSQLPIRNGRVFSFAPQALSDDLLYKFESGDLNEKIITTSNSHLVPVENDSRIVLTNIICEYLNADADNYCVIEEPIAMPSDAWVLKSGINYVYIGDEMYYFLDISNCDKNTVEKLIKIGEAYYFLCVLGKLNIDLHPDTTIKGEINSELIQLMAANIDRLFVTAYDGEGYLMWER